ncbi:MAG: DUF454 domain-containing protein [Proteobacteria bacterium]|nr:MAG: DUF454 domain-containing protein [Pseudomonadota bacterium]
MDKPVFVDYSHEVKLIGSPFIRFVLITFALVFLALGIIGIFLPLLPTTPFILLASACYARSSVRFYNWLMNQKTLGPPLRTWKEKGAISRKNKLISVGMIAITVIPAVIFWIPVVFAKFLVATICTSVSIFIWTRPEG